MPLRSEPMEEPSLNLTPMIDVVLQLVIFFMVGTQFTQAERQYDIKLPTVSEAQPLTSLPDELIVNISQNGILSLGARQVTADDLETALREARRRYEDQLVVIRGDGDGKYQAVMTVLNICRRAGITNIQLANRLEAESGP